MNDGTTVDDTSETLPSLSPSLSSSSGEQQNFEQSSRLSPSANHARRIYGATLLLAYHIRVCISLALMPAAGRGQGGPKTRLNGACLSSDESGVVRASLEIVPS